MRERVALERLRSLSELRADVRGREEGQGIEGFTEGGQMSLSSRVFTVLKAMGDALCGSGGLVPRVGPALAVRLVGGVEALANLGEG